MKFLRRFLILGLLLVISQVLSWASDNIKSTNPISSEQKADKDGWRQLFNGKDLTGWKHVGPGSQYVDEGFIKSKGGMGLLYWTGEKFGNCTFRIVFRMRDKNWNTMENTLDESRTIVILNSVKVTDFKEGDPVPERKFDFEPQRGPRPETGYFGLQNHGDSDVVFFKEVAVKMLKK